QRPRRIVHEHRWHAGRQNVGHADDHEAGGAPPHGVAQKGMAVEALASDGEEGLADAEAAAVDRHAAHRDAEIAAEERTPGAPHDVFHAECRHAPSYVPISRSTARAMARSSKGRISVPTIWYVSWP